MVTVIVMGAAACAAISAPEHGASSANMKFQLGSPGMLIDPDQYAAGFDKDPRRVAISETQSVCRSCADNSNDIDTWCNRHGNFGADRPLDNLLHDSGKLIASTNLHVDLPCWIEDTSRLRLPHAVVGAYSSGMGRLCAKPADPAP